jgi:hypothetical protein
LIQDISEAAKHQATTSAHISNTMNVIQEITSQTLSGTNDTATSIGELAGMAVEMKDSVSGFILPGKDFDQEPVDSDEPVALDELDDGSLGALFAVADEPNNQDSEVDNSVETDNFDSDEFAFNDTDEKLNLDFASSVDAEPELDLDEEIDEELEVDEGEELENLEEFEAEVEAMLTEGDDDKRN